MRQRSGLIAALALTGNFALADARPDPGAPEGRELLQLDSIAPADGGFAITLSIDEEGLGRLGVEALETYLRENRPRLFSDVSLGLIRYRNPRIVARELRARSRPGRDDTLRVDIRAEVVADKYERELVCEFVGWNTSCDNRWLDRGAGPIASLDASGDVRLSVRDDAALVRKPVAAQVSVRRIRGSVEIGGIAGLGLELDLAPPYRADAIALGPPRAAKAPLRSLGDLVLRDIRVSNAPEGRIELVADVGAAPP